MFFITHCSRDWNRNCTLSLFWGQFCMEKLHGELIMCIIKHIKLCDRTSNLPWNHSKIRSDGRCTSSSLPFMVWWVPYLNKRLRLEFNNGLEMTWIVATVWTHLHLFETDLYNGPSLGYGVYICLSHLLMVSWQVPHLSMGSRPDFNNDLGAD